MKIAPKPKAGQEISLENLLKMPEESKFDLGTKEGWKFWPVNTGEGQVAVKLSKDLCGSNTRDGLRAGLAGSTWDLISTDELFGLMTYFQAGKYEAADFIKEALTICDLHFSTLITYDPAGSICAANRNNMRASTFKTFDFRAATQMLFGTEYELPFVEAWNKFFPGIPEFTFNPEPDKSKITYQTIIRGNIIHLVQYPSQNRGYGMTVQTKKVNT